MVDTPQSLGDVEVLVTPPANDLVPSNKAGRAMEGVATPRTTRLLSRHLAKGKKHNVWLIGHRGFGASNSAVPENTICALRAGMAAVMTGVETDVQLTSDHQFVLYHNDLWTDGRPISSVSAKSMTNLDDSSSSSSSSSSEEECERRVPTLGAWLDYLMNHEVHVPRSPMVSSDDDEEEEEEDEQEDQQEDQVSESESDGDNSEEKKDKEERRRKTRRPRKPKSPMVPTDFKCILELKSPKFGDCDAINSLVKYLSPQLARLRDHRVRITFSSFRHKAILNMHEALEAAKLRDCVDLALLFNAYDEKFPPHLVDYINRHHAQEAHCSRVFVTEKLVDELHANGTLVMAWFPLQHKFESKADLLAEQKRLLDIGVDVLCSDHIAELRQQLRELGYDEN